jgi:hypothetical protein
MQQAVTQAVKYSVSVPEYTFVSTPHLDLWVVFGVFLVGILFGWLMRDLIRGEKKQG